MRSYDDFISAAKAYANAGEEQKLKLFTLLITFEEKKALWADTAKTWDALLRKECLCTPARYSAFKEAIRLKIEVETFGVSAATAIVQLEKEDRTKVLKLTRDWIKLHQIPPTYQRIATYLRQLKDEMGIKAPASTTDKLRRENTRLKNKLTAKEAYVEKLQVKLRENGIRIPQED